MDRRSVLLSVGFMFQMFFDDDEEQSLIKIDNNAEESVPRMRDKQFCFHFRLSPETFEDLLNKCSLIYKNQFTVGNPGLDIEKRLMIFIWYMANLECFRSVADRFGVSISTAWETFYKMCNVMFKINKEFKIVDWSENSERLFFRKAAFPGCVGAIDGSHIPIRAPVESPNSYMNQKGYHSMLLQAVCNPNYLFMDCYTGEAGSIHDALLFKRSDLSNKLPQLLTNSNYHLLGDSAYKLTQHILVPYRNCDNLTQTQKNYNIRHAKTHVVIQKAFALLKGRFRRLKLLEMMRLDALPLVIIAGCVLHNICILNGDDFINDINLENELNEERRMNVYFENNDEDYLGGRKRERIANALPR